jgi:hypothetical protein
MLAASIVKLTNGAPAIMLLDEEESINLTPLFHTQM